MLDESKNLQCVCPSCSLEINVRFIPSVQGLRQEYTEVNNNIRHYSLLRFTILTVYFVAFGGTASVAFGLLSSQSVNNDYLKLGARIAGLVITSLFFFYECLITEVLKRNRARGIELEKHLGYKQISSRSYNAIKASQRTAQFFYCILLLFWTAMIIRLLWKIIPSLINQ